MRAIALLPIALARFGISYYALKFKRMGVYADADRAGEAFRPSVETMPTISASWIPRTDDPADLGRPESGDFAPPHTRKHKQTHPRAATPGTNNRI